MNKLLTLLLLTSCISTTEVKESFEGRWYSDRLPFGDLATEAEIVLSDGNTIVVLDGENVGGGKYTIVNDVAVFEWCIDIRGVHILFLDGMLTDEVLFVRWKPSDFWYPYTSGFVRK